MTSQARRNLLHFYAECGVDVALSEEPVDRFAQSRIATERAARAGTEEHRHDPAGTVDPVTAEELPQAERPPPRRRQQPAPSPAPTVPSDTAIMAAREAAASAETLADLRATLAGFEGCNLHRTATNLVFADGNPEARVMFVGEAPGFEEDLQGLPFVGRSGQLLDRMMAAIGLDRTKAYIANVIPWRPPGNRDPTPQETEICRPFIERQIALVDPDVLVTLGKASSHVLFDTSIGITRLRGQWKSYDTGRRDIRAMATFHPAYLLRQPLQKKLAWRDFLAVQEALNSTPAPASRE